MIVVASAFAYVTVQNPSVRIIPVALGIAGLFLGPMLGVFLIGMLTRSRGSDAGNLIAITVGLVSMIFISGQHIDLLNLLHPVAAGMKPIYRLPEWMPVVSWTWFALAGAIIVFCIGVLFPTSTHARARVQERIEQSAANEDKPLALRK
jgi:Na+/proline symporter